MLKVCAVVRLKPRKLVEVVVFRVCLTNIALTATSNKYLSNIRIYQHVSYIEPNLAVIV